MPSRSSADTQKFLHLARERFRQGQDARHKQTQRELDDLRFYAGGEHQWDPETLKNRKGQEGAAGMPPLPPRPTLTINKVREPVHQVLNQERQSDMGIELVPADDWGELAPPVSEEEIELREGITRRIQRESEAADARTWGFARAAIAGSGVYRVLTRYVPGKSWDKEVCVARIFNQASVTWDPAHEQPDGSDVEWVFCGGDVPFDRYKREHPRTAEGTRNPTAQSDEAEFRALGEEHPGWFSGDKETRSVRVVEYYYTEWENKTLVKLADGSAVWEEDLPEDLPEDQIIDDRVVPQKTIKWAKIDGIHILEEDDWEGPDMPFIKILGEELQPFDAERRVEGMVRPARDAQQGYNAMVSKWVETVGYAPIPPLEIEEANIAAYGNWYQLLSTRALPWIPYRAYDETGRQIPKPERSQSGTDVAAIASSVQLFDEAIKSTTMVPSVQMGHATDPALKTKGATDALIAQGQMATSHMLDNLRRSIRYEGQIINNLLYPIYGRPGRLARMLTGENESMAVRISANGNGNGAGVPGGQPYAQPGQPTPGMGALPGAPSGSQPQMAGAVPPGPGIGPSPMGGGTQTPAKPPKTYTLTKDANFNVIVKVTRGFDSRREEESSIVGDLLQANPMFMSWFGDLFFKNQDGPGHDEMAERAEVMLDPKIQAMRTAKQEGHEVPPEVQAQLAQMKQQLDEAHGIMQKAQQELKDKTEQHQREQDTKIKLAQMAHDQAIELQKMKDATAIRVAELGAKKDILAGAYEDQEEAMALGQQQQHEAQQAEFDRQHELDKAQLGHQQALEQGAQPPPVNPNQPPPGGTL